MAEYCKECSKKLGGMEEFEIPMKGVFEQLEPNTWISLICENDCDLRGMGKTFFNECIIFKLNLGNPLNYDLKTNKVGSPYLSEFPLIVLNFDHAKEIIAKKYGLGSTLVMGHKEKYWNEAVEILLKQIHNRCFSLACKYEHQDIQILELYIRKLRRK